MIFLEMVFRMPYNYYVKCANCACEAHNVKYERNYHYEKKFLVACGKSDSLR